jgi:hypothetical protein
MMIIEENSSEYSSLKKNLLLLQDFYKKALAKKIY